MVIKTRAIVLHTTKYADDRWIVDLFTEANGYLSFSVKVGQSRRSQSKRSVFQPLRLLNVEYELRITKSLQIFKQVDAIAYSTLPYDTLKISMSMFLAEFLKITLKGEVLTEFLFDYIYNHLLWLDHATKDFSNFHLVFLLHLTSFLGFSPNLSRSNKSIYFDMVSGAFVEKQPIHKHYLFGVEALILPKLFRISISTMHILRLSRNQRNRMLDVLIEYYRLHLPSFPELKSLEVLKEIFG